MKPQFAKTPHAQCNGRCVTVLKPCQVTYLYVGCILRDPFHKFYTINRARLGVKIYILVHDLWSCSDFRRKKLKKIQKCGGSVIIDTQIILYQSNQLSLVYRAWQINRINNRSIDLCKLDGRSIRSIHINKDQYRSIADQYWSIAQPVLVPVLTRCFW